MIKCTANNRFNTPLLFRLVFVFGRRNLLLWLRSMAWLRRRMRCVLSMRFACRANFLCLVQSMRTWRPSEWFMLSPMNFIWMSRLLAALMRILRPSAVGIITRVRLREGTVGGIRGSRMIPGGGRCASFSGRDRRCMIACSGSLGGYHTRSAEFSRFYSGGHCGTAMVY